MNRISPLVLLSVLISSSTWAATVTVDAVAPYSLGGSSSDTVTYLSQPLVRYDSGSGYINIQDNEAVANNIFFDVTNDVSDTVEYAVGFAQISGSTKTFIPISSVDGVNCNPPPSPPDPNSPCGTAVSSYSRVVRINKGGTSRIGINMQSVCIALGSLSTSCQVPDTLHPPAVLNSLDMKAADARTWNFIAYIGTDTEMRAASVTPPTSSTSAYSTQFTINLQGLAPTATCPSDLSTLYFPGDGEIIFDPSKVTALQCANCGVASALKTLVVMGNEGGSLAPQPPASLFSTPSLSSAYPLLNYGVPFSSNSVPIGGFTNSTKDTDHPYSIGVVAIDEAGAVSDASAGGCVVNGVRTSEVQGFLAKSKCFIATAAFDSGDAAAVRMLRNFRDQVLLESELGSKFVKAYYHYSPSLAEWVIDHPASRIPALFFLIPVELIAFLFLHPMLMVLLFVSGLVLVFSVPKKRVSA